MDAQSLLQPRLYFSYSQFFVYDSAVKGPGCLWTDAQVREGFARRESAISFGTLLEFGFADVAFRRGPFQPSEAYERVIAVPFVVFTGKVMVDDRKKSRLGGQLSCRSAIIRLSPLSALWAMRKNLLIFLLTSLKGRSGVAKLLWLMRCSIRPSNCSRRRKLRDVCPGPPEKIRCQEPIQGMEE